MIKLTHAAALGALLLASAGSAVAANHAALKTGTVVTYTLSSDPSVRKVGTIVEVQRQPSAVWYSIQTTDMHCGKDRDVVRSDFVVSVGGTLPCGAAKPAVAAPSASPAPAPASPEPADPLGRALGKIRNPF